MSDKGVSVPRMFGIPTLIAGVFATVMVFAAGGAAGVLSEPGYWPAIIGAVPWIPIGLFAIYWDARVVQNVLIWSRIKKRPTAEDSEER